MIELLFFRRSSSKCLPGCFRCGNGSIRYAKALHDGLSAAIELFRDLTVQPMIYEKFRQLVDKTGCPFLIGECGREDLSDVMEMYDAFSPKSISQGLPPADDDARHGWVQGLFERGVNFAVWMESRIVGHSALICDLDKNDGEYIIFVVAPCRNRGLGSELTEMAVKKARDMGLNTLWLTVESYNFRAIRLYRKVGFKFCDEGEQERTMVLHM